MVKIEIIPVLKDNYIWVVSHNNAALIVDPGVAAPVIEFLQSHALRLTAILATHKHWDHTDGIMGLIEKFPDTPVYGPKYDGVPGVTNDVVDGQTLDIKNFPAIKVLTIPGHTRGHVAYLIENNLFCGDTLFAAGCGRVFDGTYEELFASLQKIAALPADTRIYCAHEYTLANLKFAEAAEPENVEIKQRIQACEQLRQQSLPTLPSNIALEKATNPFLRVPDFAAFKNLREWKNNF
jgi:hydroxyacylglutathione hydrolase